MRRRKKKKEGGKREGGKKEIPAWGILPSSTHSVNIAEHHQLLITVPGAGEKDENKKTKLPPSKGFTYQQGRQTIKCPVYGMVSAMEKSKGGEGDGACPGQGEATDAPQPSLSSGREQHALGASLSFLPSPPVRFGEPTWPLGKMESTPTPGPECAQNHPWL